MIHLPIHVTVSPDKTKAFVILPKVGSSTMATVLESRHYWKKTDPEDVLESCQVYGLIRHPISRYASALMQEWMPFFEKPTPLLVKLFRHTLDNNFSWVMANTNERSTAEQYLSLSPFTNIKLIQFENFSDIWEHLEINNPHIQLNDSRANGYMGTAKVLIERAANAHEDVLLHKYAEDVLLWEQAA